MEMEKYYVSPEVEVLEVEVEMGFVASPDDPNGGVDPGIGGIG